MGTRSNTPPVPGKSQHTATAATPTTPEPLRRLLVASRRVVCSVPKANKVLAVVEKVARVPTIAASDGGCWVVDAGCGGGVGREGEGRGCRREAVKGGRGVNVRRY